MKENIKQYIREEINKLKNKDESVELECVYPEILNDVLGDNDEPYDLNGYDCDYWMTIGSYDIFGTMRFGTATVTLNRDLK